MINSSLFKILKSFSRAQLRSFEKFADSPYFNTSRSSAELLKEIIKYYPGFSSPQFTKENLFKAVYPKNDFNSLLFRKNLSNLINLSEKFLTVENQYFKNSCLLKGLRKNKLFDLYNLRHKKIVKENKNFLINEEYLLGLSFIEGENTYYHYETDNYVEYEKGMENVFQYDSLFYFYKFAQTFIRLKNVAVIDPGQSNNLIGYLHKNLDMESLVNDINGSSIQNKDIFYHLIRLVQFHSTRDVNLYNEIREFSFNYSSNHSSSIIYIGYIYLLDFISYKINSGEIEYMRERHKIYKKMEKDYYSTGNAEITLIQFKNFFLSGIKTGDLEFSRYILGKYIDALEKRGNPGLKKFFESRLLFISGDFTESLKIITSFKTSGLLLDDYFLVPEIRVLMLQLYYELDYLEEAIYLGNAFQQLLKKNKRLSIQSRKFYGNFLKIYIKLLNDKMNHNAAKNEKFEGQIRLENTTEKSWLLEKLYINENLPGNK